MKKNKDIQYIKIGIFVFVALMVAMLFILMIGSDKKVFQSRYTLIAKFSDISGLRVGAAVRLAGIKVGFVDDIEFPKDINNKDIIVRLKLGEKYQDRIREDSTASINTQGLLGDKYIYVSIGTADKPVLKDKDLIQTKNIVGLFELAEKGGDILKDFHEVAQNLSKFLSGIDNDKDGIKGIVDSVTDILKTTKKGRGLLHALIYDPRGEDILKSFSQSMNSLNVLLSDTSAGAARRGKMQNLVKNMNEVAHNLNEITTKVNRGQGTLGGLILDPTIYNDIRSIFGKANRNSLFQAVVRTTLEENDKEVLK